MNNQKLKNINVIKTGIDIRPILEQLMSYQNDWGNQSKIPDSESMLDYGFPELDVGVLQLTMGGVDNIDEYVGDTNICINTPAYEHHSNIFKILKRYGIKNIARCGFLSIPVDGIVGHHIDVGDYYLTRDRFHLSIQGIYDYTVGDETYRVHPGTLLQFNNKIMHGTQNVGDVVRITFVFDVPMKHAKKVTGISYCKK